MNFSKNLVTSGTLCALFNSMAATQEVRIGSQVSCASCSIALEKVTTLASVHFPWPATLIQRDPTASVIYLVDGDGYLSVFDRDGRTLQRIGRRGAGPGEYEMIHNVLVAPNGSIQVLDGQLSRLSTYSNSGEYRGSTPIRISTAMGNRAVVLQDGQIVANVRPTPYSGATYVLQRIDQKGSTSRLFDQIANDEIPLLWRHERLLWQGQTGELIVAHPWSFAIEIYSKDLTAKRSITRVADWIPTRVGKDQPSDGVFDKPPAPRLSAVWENPSGLLWLLMIVPSERWKPGPPMAKAASLTSDEYSALVARPRVQMIIEIVELAKGTVLARSQFEGPIGLPFGGGYFARSVEDSTSGEQSLMISRIQLKR